MYSSLTVLALAAFSAETLALATRNYSPKTYKHVAVFSVDGMHSSDVEKYLAIRPASNMAMLLSTGYEFTDAYTSAPSDSFPGTVAQFTGASPRTTGIWYDDTYDRTYFAPGSNCSGTPGAEVVYDESIDYNSTELFSGGIDPANLPRTLVNGKCTSIYPHMRLRVNTAFEVVRAAGLQTAYTDKHPAYDLVRGPSGTGLSEGYFPEIAAVPNNVNSIIAYDQYHVNAILDWINGTSPQHAEGSISQIPAFFGGNFQSVNVAQKTVGYNKDLSFSSALIQAFDAVDAGLGKIVAALKAKNVYDDTLIIVASKHGNAPINPALYNTVPPLVVTNATKVKVDFQTSDDIALLWLKNQSDVSKAAAGLNAARSSAKILNVIYGANLTAQGFGDPLTDNRVPDIIVQPQLGTTYTTSTKKLAEHGGLSYDDRVVACFISNPSLQKKQITQRVSTRQVAPTILEALGLNPYALQGVVAEGTKSLFQECQW